MWGNRRMTLHGKTALITGSVGGIGYATAGKLAAAGCTVVLHGIEKIHDGIAVARQLQAVHGGQAIYLRADLTVADGDRQSS